MTVDFNDYFWGEKNNGFDVLYHNMKYGLVAGKELSDFFRERSNIEEYNTKLMTKLANKAGSGCVHGTFAPIWVVLRSSAERISSIHVQLVQKVSELVKDVAKYADELHKKHKSVKEEESGTLDAVQAMQASTLAVQKAKDLYTGKMQELEKLRKDNSSPKEMEKVEAKARKHQDDYKALIEKHNPVKMEFEKKMTTTCKRFQEIEEAHLKQMREFLATYIELLQSNHDMVGQVHSEFKRQFLEMTVDKLLEQFVLNKYTGLEKPEIVELDFTNWPSSSPTNQSVLNTTNQSPVSSTTAAGMGDMATTSASSATMSPPANRNDSVESTIGGASVTPSSGTSAPKKELSLRSWFSTSSPSSSSSPPITANRTQSPSKLSTIGDNSALSDDVFAGQSDNVNSIVAQTPALSSSPNLSAGGGSGSGGGGGTGGTGSALSSSVPMHGGGGGVSTTAPTASAVAVTATTTTTTVAVAATSAASTQQQTIASPPVVHQQKLQQQQQPQPQLKHQQQPSISQQQIQQQQPLPTQQKSSRRTTSLLNLFMSNSQGNRECRDVPRPNEALSAPTSPSEKETTQNHDNSQYSGTNIGRNPLRGSKFSGFLRSRREKAKTKKSKKKKDQSDTSNNKEEKPLDIEEKEESIKSEPSLTATSAILATNVAPTATPEVDEDGYCIQPKEPAWETAAAAEKESFYSSSDSDSGDDERERKIHVEIKPLNNGTAPISASVDELRATVENLSLSPIGILSQARRGSNSESDSHMKRSQSVSQQIGDKPSNDLLGLNLFQQQQSPGASNASTPTTTHPYAPLQSPTLSASNNSTNRYADLGDIFSEIGEISASAPASANITRLNRQIPTPTSGNSIAIPRPPSRRSEAAIRGRVSPSSISRADSIGSLEFRAAGVAIGSSRGPSPLTIGMTDTIPLAVAFHEIIHAYFRGSDESRCQAKISGDMMLSFPAGIVGVLANNPNPAKLGFRIKNVANLDQLLPNKQLVTIDKLQSTSFSTMLEFNMPALTALLRRQSEQNPTASYFNVDILKYQVRSKSGAWSCPFQLVSYWKCESSHTDLKIDYKYNSHAMALASPLLNVAISVPVDGGVRNVQSKPHSAWLGESNKLVWNFTDISQHSDNNGVGTLRARLEVNSGPSTPSILTTQFNCEGTTLSGIEFELAGPGYRLSLVKRRFVSGKYICEGDGIRGIATPTPPSVGSPNSFSGKSG